ncbi:sulfotransferase [Undibacterium sp. JH2W]|uniref:sulfotransferase n=1 Tax=Undibacterium sp. JH2W TaxID=3413037 RepID=UPI003BEFF567
MASKPGFEAEERALLRGQQIDYQQLASMQGWFPVAIDTSTGDLCWRHVGLHRFLESFFLDTLNQQNREQRQLCQTPLSLLSEQVQDLTQVGPTAFIFHVSRCGSTLLTQMLASLPQCIVMSEPPVIDAFFRYHHAHHDLPGAVSIFRHLIAALGQKRHMEERHFFIKFDSWHLPWVDFVRSAYPDIPIVFLYREPAAVLASHRRQRGPQMIPGLLNTSRLKPDAQHMLPGDFDLYAASVLSSMFRSADEHALTANLILLNYPQLPGILWEELLALFQIECEDREMQKLKARSGLHSKNRHISFTGDPQSARLQTHGMELQYMQHCTEIYSKLESLRQKVKIC